MLKMLSSRNPAMYRLCNNGYIRYIHKTLQSLIITICLLTVFASGFSLYDSTYLNYKLDENGANTTVYDPFGVYNGLASGNTNTFSFPEGIDNKGMNFTGNKKITQTSLPDGLLPASTLDFWMYSTVDRKANYPAFIQLYQNGTSRIQFVWQDDGQYWYICFAYDFTLNQNFDTGINVALNQWNHITWAYDGTDKLMFYLNGINRINKTGITCWFNDYINGDLQIAYEAASGVYYLQSIDEITLFNRTLNASEVLKLNYTFFPFADDVTPPVITITGLDTTYNETYNYDLNVTITLNEIGSCRVPTAVWSINSTGTGTSFIARETSLNTGFYMFNATCTDKSSNTAEKLVWFYKDKVIPVVTWLSGTNASYMNTGMVSLNWTCTDDNNLWLVNMNVSDIYATQYYNFTGSPINKTYYSRSFSLNTINMSNSTYTVNSVCCDSHTATIFNKPIIQMNNDNLVFNMPDTSITIKDMSGLSVKTNSKCITDRCGFEFEYSSEPGLKRWLLTSDKKIVWLENSKYPGHFIIDGAYWIDFMPLSKLIVTDNKDGSYEISTWEPLSAKIELNSIGALNCKNDVQYFTLVKIPVPQELYTPNRLTNTGWFNIDNMNLTTIPGVLLLLFSFVFYFALLYMAYLSRVAAMQIMPMLYGFFLGWLITVTISVIAGVCFIILALVLGLSLIASMF